MLECGIHCSMCGKARLCINYTRSESQLYILSLFFTQLVCIEHTFSSYPGHELKCVLRESQVDLEPSVIFASSSFFFLGKTIDKLLCQIKPEVDHGRFRSP